MKIEAVTVCINYADRFEEVVAYNASLFDKWIVMTTPDDKATRTLCRRYGLHCITSTEHEKNGDVFNKGRLIERGLHHTSRGAWRLHIDADIALPSFFRRYLDHAHLDTKNIYGADRAMVHNNVDWNRLKASGYLDRRYSPHSVDFPKGFEVGSRWASQEAGYVPIGFFQLWYEDEQHGVRIRPYPSAHGSACRSDVQHALQWDRRNRVLLPELIVVHIDDGEPCGSNWLGRGVKAATGGNCS